MKRGSIVFLLLLWVLVLPTDGTAQGPATVTTGEGQARVTLIEGTAQVMKAGMKDWIALKVGDGLINGDDVQTGVHARLEVLLADNTILRFADNTRFRVEQIDINKEQKQRNIKIDVVLGRTWAHVKTMLGVKSDIELSCEHAVAGVRGTIYRMNVYDDTSALVRVYDGQVAVTGAGKRAPGVTDQGRTPYRVAGPYKVPGPRKVSMEEWTYIVSSMQQIKIRADGWAEQPSVFSGQEDANEWVDWNKRRDSATSPE